jgi:Cft2 family RNA processing exonuclease
MLHARLAKNLPSAVSRWRKRLSEVVPSRRKSESLSAAPAIAKRHAGRDEIIEWLRGARRRPEVAYIIHGDPPASEALRAAITQQLGWHAVAPRHLEQVRID